MSILSEAWRRAHGGDARLAQTLGAPGAGLRQRPALLPWLLCGLLVALAAGLGVYIWLVHGRPPQPVPALAAATAAPVVPQRKAATPFPVQAQAARPAAPRIEQRNLAAGPASASPAAGDDAGVRASRTASLREATADNATGPSKPLPVRRRTAAAPPSGPIALTAAPDAVRSAFPSLDIVVHVWNADPAARFIMIGTRQFHEGDEIAPGVRLLAITRGGEIVGFRGYRLILP